MNVLSPSTRRPPAGALARTLAAAATAAVAALAVGPSAAAAQSAPPARSVTWSEVTRTAQVVALIDTARVERAGRGSARVWYRFVYITPLSLGGESPTRYGATEMKVQVDCRKRRARTLELYMESTEGVQAGVPTPESGWRGFDRHPLGSAAVFPAACRAIGEPAASAPTAPR